MTHSEIENKNSELSKFMKNELYPWMDYYSEWISIMFVLEKIIDNSYLQATVSLKGKSGDSNKYACSISIGGAKPTNTFYALSEKSLHEAIFLACAECAIDFNKS